MKRWSAAGMLRSSSAIKNHDPVATLPSEPRVLALMSG
jgi:hypothetical protein